MATAHFSLEHLYRNVVLDLVKWSVYYMKDHVCSSYFCLFIAGVCTLDRQTETLLLTDSHRIYF